MCLWADNFCLQQWKNYYKKLSCRREAARCFVFVSSQLQHTYSAVFLLLVTAASDLLVHKILLHSVLLSPIVSGGVRPKPPGQTPIGHNPLVFCRSWVGWGQDPNREADMVRSTGSVSFQQNTRRVLSYDVLRQQKTRLWPKGCVQGGGWPPSPAYNVEPVTNTSSSSCANNGRQTPRCARRSPPSVAALFLTIRDSYVDNSADLYAATPDIRPESRFYAYPTCIRRPLTGASEYSHHVWHGKTRMAWLPGAEKISKISLFVLTQLTNVTDTQTHTHTAWRHRSRLCIASRRKNRTIFAKVMLKWKRVQFFGPRVYNCVTVFVCKPQSDRQWLWDHAIKFARWQHHATGRWARFAFLWLWEHCCTRQQAIWLARSITDAAPLKYGTERFNPSMATLKRQSNGPLYSQPIDGQCTNFIFHSFDVAL